MRVIKTIALATIAMTSICRSQTMMKQIVTAHLHVKKLKHSIVELLNKQSPLTLKDHIRKLERLIDDLDLLIKDAAAIYQRTSENKFTLFIRILKIFKKNAIVLRDTLKKKYFFFLTFAMALRSEFNKINTPKYKENLIRKIESFKEKLNIHEKKELEKLIKTLESIQELVPTSKLRILAILRAVYNR